MTLSVTGWPETHGPAGVGGVGGGGARPAAPLSGPGGPETHGSPPASASQVLNKPRPS